MNSKALREKLIVAQLNISRWGAKTYDKKATKAVEATYHTKHDVGRFHKEVIDSKELKEIDKLCGEMRSIHYTNTLPWGDNGDRLLPITNYKIYKDGMDDLIEKFNVEVENFVNKYPQLKEEAAVRLNGLFDAKDYPEDIRPKFGIRINYTPIPIEDDVRLDLPDEDLNLIKESLTNNVTIKLEDALKDIWVRIEILLDKMVERLSDSNNMFKNSLIENISDLIQVAPKLNVFNNPDLENTCKRMRELLVDPDNLRKNPSLRRLIAGKAAEIVNEVKNFASAGSRVLELD